MKNEVIKVTNEYFNDLEAIAEDMDELTKITNAMIENDKGEIKLLGLRLERLHRNFALFVENLSNKQADIANKIS